MGCCVDVMGVVSNTHNYTNTETEKNEFIMNINHTHDYPHNRTLTTQTQSQSQSHTHALEHCGNMDVFEFEPTEIELCARGEQRHLHYLPRCRLR